MKAPTLVFYFLATLSSVVFALPSERRQFNTLQASLAQLDSHVVNFNKLVATLGITLYVDVELGPLLDGIAGDYDNCNSALQKNGKLSPSQAQESISQYHSSTSNFSNGLNQLAASRNNNGFGGVTASLQAFQGTLSAKASVFAGNLASNSPNNGANQDEINNTNSGLQSALQNAFGSQ